MWNSLLLVCKASRVNESNVDKSEVRMIKIMETSINDLFTWNVWKGKESADGVLFDHIDAAVADLCKLCKKITNAIVHHLNDGQADIGGTFSFQFSFFFPLVPTRSRAHAYIGAHKIPLSNFLRTVCSNDANESRCFVVLCDRPFLLPLINYAQWRQISPNFVRMLD